ncbi:VTC domain-containing protein, partial [Verrucomicrobiota bacterium]
VVLVRYTRESYFSKLDHYARVTLDSDLKYQPTNSWNSWGRGKRWFRLDTPLIQNKDYGFSGVVLELKTLSDTPQWMIDLVMEFDLVRTGHCKYSNAVWAESLFRGTPDAPSYGVCLFSL